MNRNGDAFGLGKDVFFKGDGNRGERVVGEEVVSAVVGEGFDEVARVGGGELLDFGGDGGVVYGVSDVIVEAEEALGGAHLDGDEQGLCLSAFRIGHADMRGDLESANFDRIRRDHVGVIQAEEPREARPQSVD